MSKHHCLSIVNPWTKAALGIKGKFWETGQALGIGFMGGSSSQIARVKSVLNQWTNACNIIFDYNSTDPQIRVSFVAGNGSWSYVGRDCLSIPSTHATMNLGWIDDAVILHEFGHALGLGHEHQNPEGGIQWDEAQVIKELSGPPNNWSVSTIQWNVIDAYTADKVIGTKLDPKSIMMYPIPNSWTLNNFSTGFNDSLSPQDKEFIHSLYPFAEVVVPEINLVDSMRQVFTCLKDIKRLNEDQIVTLGLLLGAETNAKKYTKRVNAEMVLGKLEA